MNRSISGLIARRFQTSQRGLLLVLALVLGCVVFTPAAARAAGPNCTVNGAGGADYITIQAAVSDTGCATITVVAGIYQEHATIGRDVTISGAGASSTTVDGTQSGAVFTITGGTVTLQYLTIANGSSDTSGGIYNSGGSVTVSNSTVSGNSASFGGGIRNHAILTVSNSTISGNSVGSFRGGGLFNQGTLTVSNSTISGNSAAIGGGIFNQVGSVTVSNSTVSGNSASSSGGGIFNNANGTLTMKNSTLAGNSAFSSGGGILNNGGSLTVSNTIIANSPSGADCAGSLNNDSGGNLADDGSCNFMAASSRNSTDPNLDPAGLKDNGGSTKTIALMPGSPAIDTAVSCPPPATDQRGVARPQGSGCDSGAYELRAAFPSTAVLDSFNRANGKVGGNWDGLTDTSFYKIASNTLEVQLGGPLVWKPAVFGTTQEAFVTLATIDAKNSSQGLLLKVQTGTVPNAGAISVVYDAKAKAVQVSALRLERNGAWTVYPNQATTFANGDVLGARAKANGTILIYKNGTQVAGITLNAADQAFFNSKGGKIGIWTVAASNAVMDDFGGGNAAP